MYFQVVCSEKNIFSFDVKLHTFLVPAAAKISILPLETKNGCLALKRTIYLFIYLFTRTCNCPKTKTCPLQGKCLLDNVVYQARVKSDNSEETYIGLASTTFKSRLGNHHKAMKNSKYRHDTTLSLHIWDLKDKGEDYEINWKFIGRAQTFSPISGICNLCTLEKYVVDELQTPVFKS